MSVLVTTNEPRNIKDLFIDSIEVPMNFDFLLYTEPGKVGIERKHVPDDLLSSVADGRLGREITAMREECQFRVLLLHGIIKYQLDGRVNFGRKQQTRWTEKGVRNLLRTVQYVEGCYIETAKTTKEIPVIVQEIQDFFDKTNHLSMKSRPGVMTQWVVPTHGEKTIHFYQGIPGLAIAGAKKLYDKYPNPLNLFNATIEDLSDIPRFGTATAKRIHDFLRGL